MEEFSDASGHSVTPGFSMDVALDGSSLQMLFSMLSSSKADFTHSEARYASSSPLRRSFSELGICWAIQIFILSIQGRRSSSFTFFLPPGALPVLDLVETDSINGPSTWVG